MSGLEIGHVVHIRSEFADVYSDADTTDGLVIVGLEDSGGLHLSDLRTTEFRHVPVDHVVTESIPPPPPPPPPPQAAPEPTQGPPPPAELFAITTYRHEKAGVEENTFSERTWSEIVKQLTKGHVRLKLPALPDEATEEHQTLVMNQVKTEAGAWGPHRIAGKRRLQAGVIYVSLAVLDVDSASQAEADAAEARIRERGLACVVHSSFKHSIEHPKSRYVLRLSRKVLLKEWPLFWPRLGPYFGLPPDESCKDASRLYYNPACPEDGPEPFVRVFEGAALDVDAVLAMPASTIPPKRKAPRQDTGRESSAKTSARPDSDSARANEINHHDVARWLGIEADDGTVTCPGCGETDGVAILDRGLYCHRNRCKEKPYRSNIDMVMEVHGVSAREAIDLLAKQFGLPDVDPLTAFGIAANAAGILSRVEADPTKAFEKDMIEFVASLPEASPDEERARIWLKGLRPAVRVAIFDSCVATARAERRTERQGREPDWKEGLMHDKEGETRRSSANVITMLTGDPAWAGVLRFNEFANRIELAKPAPWRDETGTAGAWTEGDDLRLVAHVERELWFSLTPRQCRLVALNVAQRDRFNPICDYLSSLTWDGVPRVERLAHMYLGAEENDYTKNVSRWLMIDAVRRAFEPGCKADCMIVLEGKQGTFKSTAIRVLAGDEYFSDTPLDFQSKDRFEQLPGNWFYEIAELDGLVHLKADLARVKSFLSSATDNYRNSYGAESSKKPRRCVLVGTVNLDAYLRDETGNRRFLPIRCGTIDIDTLKAHRDQLWAEAVALYKAGAKSWPTTDRLRKLVLNEQGKRVEADAWQDRIAEWILSVADEEAKHPNEPKTLLRKIERGGKFRHQALTPAEVLEGPLGIKPGDWKPTDQNRVVKALKALGYVRTQIRQNDWRKRGWFYVRDTPVDGAEGEDVTTATSDGAGGGDV